MMASPFRRFMQFWTEERSLTALLVLLVVHLLVIVPAATIPYGIVIIEDLLLSLLLVAGMLNIRLQRTLRLVGIAIITLTVLTRWTAVFVERPWLAVARPALAAVSLLAISVVVFLQVNREGPVTGHRIRGAIAGYLLIGTLFAHAYAFIERVHPHSFAFPGWLSRDAVDWGDVFSYFSIVTLTTLGYGDISAVHPFARALVMLEALIGQLYPAILIARLVTLQLETRRAGTSKE